MVSNVVLFDVSGRQVTIGTTNVEEIWSRVDLIKINAGVSSLNWGSGPTPTKVVDLLRINRRFNIDGWISDDEGMSTGDTSPDAIDKKLDLEALFQSGGIITISTTTAVEKSVILEKLAITELTEDAEANPTKFRIKFSALEAENQT